MDGLLDGTDARRRSLLSRREWHRHVDGDGARHESVEVAGRFFSAFNRSVADGVDDYFELLDPDVEWIPITALLDGRCYRGREGVRRWVEEMRHDWRVYEVRWTEVRALGEGRVLAFGAWDCAGRRGGVHMSFDQAAWLMELRGGKMVRLQSFAARSDALEAAGLSA